MVVLSGFTAGQNFTSRAQTLASSYDVYLYTCDQCPYPSKVESEHPSVRLSKLAEFMADALVDLPKKPLIIQSISGGGVLGIELLRKLEGRCQVDLMFCCAAQNPDHLALTNFHKGLSLEFETYVERVEMAFHGSGHFLRRYVIDSAFCSLTQLGPLKFEVPCLYLFPEDEDMFLEKDVKAYFEDHFSEFEFKKVVGDHMTVAYSMPAYDNYIKLMLEAWFEMKLIRIEDLKRQRLAFAPTAN